MTLEESIEGGIRLAQAHVNGTGESVHNMYHASVEIANEISRHYLYNAHPGDLLTERRPSEPVALQQYREKTYEQVTFSAANKIVGVQRGFLFNEELYKVEYPDTPPTILDDFPFKDYIENLPDIGNFFEYCQEYVLQFADIDPNGYFAIIPSNFESEDASEILTPVPEYIPCDNVLDFGSDYVFVKSTAKTALPRGQEGEIFYLFTKDFTLRFEQSESPDSKPVFTPQLVHEHYWGDMMIRKIKGVVSTQRGTSVLDRQSQILHLSHVSPTIPHLNNVLKHWSDLEGAIVNHLYPPKYEGSIDCPRCEGEGEIWSTDGESKSKCGLCDGNKVVGLSKLTAGTGPFVGYVVDPDDTGKINVPAGYVTNSDVISAIQEAVKLIQSEKQAAYAAVNMEFILDRSARQKTEKEIRDDSKLFESFLIQSKKTIFPLCQWMLDAMNYSRNITLLGGNRDRLEETRILIHGPNTFDTTNPNAALDQIIKANEAKVDPAIIHELIKAAIPKLFGNNSNAGKKAEAMANIDPFPMMGSDELLAMQALDQDLDAEDVIIKTNLCKLVFQAIDADKEFVNLKPSDQREFIRGLIQVDESTGSAEGA